MLYIMVKWLSLYFLAGHHCVMSRVLLHIQEAPDTKTGPQIDCSGMSHVSRQLLQTNVAILKVIHVRESICYTCCTGVQ